MSQVARPDLRIRLSGSYRIRKLADERAKSIFDKWKLSARLKCDCIVTTKGSFNALRKPPLEAPRARGRFRPERSRSVRYLQRYAQSTAVRPKSLLIVLPTWRITTIDGRSPPFLFADLAVVVRYAFGA
jgi:hypothetical protein